MPMIRGSAPTKERFFVGALPRVRPLTSNKNRMTIKYLPLPLQKFGEARGRLLLSSPAERLGNTNQLIGTSHIDFLARLRLHFVDKRAPLSRINLHRQRI